MNSFLDFHNNRLRILPCKWLFPLPRMERETFSGGRNLSAIERNSARRAAARAEAKLVHLQYENTILCPDWMFDEVSAALDGQ